MKVAASPRIYMGRCPKVVGIAIRGNAFSTYGGANPVSLRSTAPSRGRGENVGRFECIYPSFLWKEVPAGRRLGAQSGVKKECLKSTIYESTLSTADAVPLPRWGRQISSGYAANIYRAMPESLSISGFPFWTFQTLPT